MKIYAVEILSVTMGLWLLWITIIYSSYIHNLRKNTKHSVDPESKDDLQEARNQRKRAYTLAVTFPSYFIFWVIVAIWGMSYVTSRP
mgnify:FL=1